jgi:hypothetical protein
VANTHELKTIAEPKVRAWLMNEYHAEFSPQLLPVGKTTAGEVATREFDAVSTDGKIVASIKCGSWKTASGNYPAGKVHALYEELYFFSLVQGAPRKLLVFTNKDAYTAFKALTDGKRHPDVELVHASLSAADQAHIDEILARSSGEIRTTKGPAR